MVYPNAAMDKELAESIFMKHRQRGVRKVLNLPAESKGINLECIINVFNDIERKSLLLFAVGKEKNQKKISSLFKDGGRRPAPYHPIAHHRRE